MIEADRPIQALGHGGTANAPTGVRRTFAPTSANIGIEGHDDKRVDVDVAIIDTGIDLDHPDLNVAGGKNCQKRTSYDDGNGHGTHVAGTVGGLDNGAGAVGMAPGARLWAVRVLDNSGSGTWSSVICGIDWVTAQHAPTIEVANMSLGGSGSDGTCASSSLHQAICNSVGSGVTYAVAAGNSSADAARRPGRLRRGHDRVPLWRTSTELPEDSVLPAAGATSMTPSPISPTTEPTSI